METPCLRRSGVLGSSLLAVIAFWLGLVTARSEDTAYGALRTVERKYGEESLSRVIQVRGALGVWAVVVAMPESSNRAREIRVRGGQIRSETTVPLPDPIGSPLKLTEVNLDSDGVLATLEETLRTHVPEELVNLALSTSSPEEGAVWTAMWRDWRSDELCLMQIAARTGAVLQSSVLAPADAGVSRAPAPENPDVRRATLVRTPAERGVDREERRVGLLRRILPF